MWLYACLGIGVCCFLLTNTGKAGLKIGGIVYDTVKDRLYNKKKNIKIVNINDKNLPVIICIIRYQISF
jgi:hypothetical protein